jgi:hypothetical protein
MLLQLEGLVREYYYMTCMEQLPKNSQLIVVTDAIQTGGACLNFSQLDL